MFLDARDPWPPAPPNWPPQPGEPRSAANQTVARPTALSSSRADRIAALRTAIKLTLLLVSPIATIIVLKVLGTLLR